MPQERNGLSLLQKIVAFLLKSITTLLFRVDSGAMGRVPANGPLIIVTNHVHMPELPTLYMRLLPRPVTGMVLASRWDNGFFRWLLNLFHIIPLRRGEADLAGLKLGLENLKKGKIVIIDPEGTRSHNGRLQEGRPGVILLALRSGAPILPVVHYGSEDYLKNLRRLRRTDFHFAVGRCFRLKPEAARSLHADRQQILGEIMAQMAALLPPQYQGAYAGVEPTHKYLVFE